MNITPVNFNNFKGRYYNFSKNDPREQNKNFKLGMPDNAIVETLHEGDNYYYSLTAADIRERYIRAKYPVYSAHLADSSIVGKRIYDEGIEGIVTAGQAREEIIEEENHQLEIEALAKLREITASNDEINSPWWDSYPY